MKNIANSGVEKFREPWTKNSVIRNRYTGSPLLVVHVYSQVCTIVVDLTTNNSLTPTFALLPRDYDKYATDVNMEAKIIQDDIMNWQYKSVSL